MNKNKVKVRITGELEISFGDIVEFDASFRSLQEEFPECKLNYTLEIPSKAFIN